MMSTRIFHLFVLLAALMFLPCSLLAGLPAAGTARAVTPSVPVYLPQVLSQTQIAPPAPGLIASNQPHPNSLVVDPDYVYWTDCGTDVASPTDGAVMVYSKGQAEVHPLVSGLSSCPALLQADDGSLFWLNRRWIPGLGEYTIFRLPKAGGQPLELASYTAVNGSLTVDDTFVYWRDASGTVMRLPKTGTGTPQPAPVPALVFAGPDAYWLNAGGDLVRSARDGSSAVVLVKGSDLAKMGGRDYSKVSILEIFPRLPEVYFSVLVDNNPGMLSCTDQRTVLMRVPGDGGAYEQVAGANGRADTFVIQPFAYFSGPCTQGLLRAGLASTAVELVPASPEYPTALAVDETYLYWVDYNNGWIKRMPK